MGSSPCLVSNCLIVPILVDISFFFETAVLDGPGITGSSINGGGGGGKSPSNSWYGGGGVGGVGGGVGVGGGDGGGVGASGLNSTPKGLVLSNSSIV